MPWKLLSAWFAEQHDARLAATPALTLVTLRLATSATADGIAFYRQAEFGTLMKWANEGRFVLAFTALDRDELTLLFTEDVVAVRSVVSELPLLDAGLAEADVRSVATLRLTSPVFPARN